MEGFATVVGGLPWIKKRPGELLDYVVDLSDYLAAAETLSSVSVVADSGISLGSPAPAITSGQLTVTLADGTSKTIGAGRAAVVWLSGGSAGGKYTITCSFHVTGSNRIVERSFEVRVSN